MTSLGRAGSAGATDVATAIRDAVVSARRAGDAAGLARALDAVPAASLAAFLHAGFDRDGDGAAALVPLTTGLGASPGAASGEVVLTADDAVAAGEAGRAVILVRSETTPDDVLGMQAASGILTARGGLASHAAVVARGWGIPAVVGAGELQIESDGLHVGGRVVPPGTVVSIDGRTGEVFLGGVAVTTLDAPPELDVLLGWADRVRHAADGPVAVRANADTASDAAHARQLGAEGIGLCRTEHMFLADDRLPLVRRFILADDPRDEAAALADLEVAQRADFEGILAAMDGLPVTVRLLDPPLHEFLPEPERLVVAEATGTLDDAGRIELAAVRRMHEVNPMIGTRGVRLGVVKPGVYQMQVRALCGAIEALVAAGRRPQVEVMIPLVVDPSEMVAARRWVDDAAAEAAGDATPVALGIGAMIETPRAALLAGDLAEVSDFFSFGTNDLTQLSFAFSRDDVGSTLLPAYLRAGLLDADPFEQLDQRGVGRLIVGACRDARAVRPDVKLGICGEHAGDPSSVRFLVDAGFDSVSCSPFRVPIARLAVAQALLAAGRLSDDALVAILASDGRGGPADPAVGREATDDAIDEHPWPAGGDAASSGDDLVFAVLHALRIKGFASAEGVAEIACVDPGIAHTVLISLVDGGLARHIPGRELYQLLPHGRERHGQLLGSVPHAVVAGLHDHYEAFLDLNLGFKELCTSWQTRNGEPNDHSDPAYDGERVAALQQLHQRSVPVLEGFAAAVPRFESYLQRLTTALARSAAGEARMFTGVMCGSYHDVWMELHEDLIQLLGVDRHAEGSF